jgi:hypothetical protein
MSQESPAVILYDANSNPLAVRDGIAIPANTSGLLPLAKLASDGKSYYFEVVDDSGTKRLLVDAKTGGRGAAGSPPVGLPVLVGGWDGTNTRVLYTDGLGRLVAVNAGSASPRRGFANGFIVYATPGLVAVRSTTYTEQSANAQRSIASASANDAAAGTGARTVKITYYDVLMDGPFEETVTLNGTSYVNTVATNICFIEKIEVVTVGSGGTNAGILTLKAATAGGGATVWTVAAGEGQTFGCHHYVDKDMTCYITGMYGGIKGADPCGFYLKSLNPLVANRFNKQITDLIRIAGNGSFLRTYNTPIEVVGPARIVGWASVDTSTSRTYYCSFDYYEQAT